MQLLNGQPETQEATISNEPTQAEEIVQVHADATPAQASTTPGQPTTPEQAPKIKLVIIAAGNGGSNIMDWLHKNQSGAVQANTQQTDPEQPGGFVVGGLDKYVLDSDAGKINLFAKQDPSVHRIVLKDETGKSFGTGGNILNGKTYALAEKAAIETIIKELANKSGVLIIAGCLGGGSTGALLAVAEIAKQNNVLTIAQVTTPPAVDGDYRTHNAFEIINQLEALGIPINDIRMEPSVLERVMPKATPLETYSYINRETIRPRLLMLESIFNLTGEVSNVDYNDLAAVFEGATALHEGIYKLPKSESEGDKPKQSQPLNINQLVKALTEHPLQNGLEILRKANKAILIVPLTFTNKDLTELKRRIKALMYNPTRNRHLSIKPHIGSQHLYDDGSEWVGLIVGANMNRFKKSGKKPEGDSGSEQAKGLGSGEAPEEDQGGTLGEDSDEASTETPTGESGETPMQAPIDESGEASTDGSAPITTVSLEVRSDPTELVVCEVILQNRLWANGTSWKKIRIPEDLRSRIKEMQDSRKPLEPSAVQKLCADAQSFIDADPQLQGSALHFGSHKIADSPSIPQSIKHPLFSR